MKRPVMLMAGSYVLGIITVQSGGTVVFPLCMVVITLVVLLKTHKDPKNLAFTAMILLTCVLLYDLGIFRTYRVQNYPGFEKYEGEDVTFSALVCAVNGQDGNYRIELQADGKENVMLFCDSEYLPGDELLLTGRIKEYPSPMNDGEFDTKAFYKCRNIGAYVYADEISLIGRNNSPEYRLKSGLYEIRKKFSMTLINIFGKKNGGVLAVMFTGDKTSLLDEVRTSYKYAGIGHLLAISGLHISMIGMGIYGLLRKTGAGIGLAGAFSMLFLFVFAVFSGEQVSCIRAMIMLSFMMGAKYFGRKYDPPTAISFAALIVLIKNPLFLTDSSFLLSFSAGGAAAFSGIISRKAELVGFGKLKEKMVRAMMFGFGLQFMILPDQLYLFWSYNIYSPVINLLLIPLMPALLVLALLSMLSFFFLPGILSIFSRPCGFILGLYFDSGGFVKELAGGHIVAGKPETVKIVSAIFVLIIVYVFFVKDRYKSAVFCLLFMLLLLIHIPKKQFELYQLYVGQGACYVIFHNDKVIICDCGSSDKEDIYNNTVRSFLEYHGYDSTDYCIVTHVDKDHFNGFEEMLGDEPDFNPCFILPDVSDHEGFDAVFEAEEEKLADYVIAKPFSNIKIDKLELDILYPDSQNAQKSENESSMVFKLKAGDKTILFTGDIPAEVEKQVASECEKKNYSLESDVLVVAHHGSRFSTSEEFLDKVKPRLALISCGINNSYGHPADETLLRLKKAGCEIHVSANEGQYRLDH